MTNRNSQLLGVWFVTWDLALTAAAWIGAYYIRFESGWLPVTKDTPDFDLAAETLHHRALADDDDTESEHAQ